MLTPRLRRFLLLLLGFAVYAAFTILTPMKVWAWIMLVVLQSLLLWIFWMLAKDPFPWPRFRHDPP